MESVTAIIIAFIFLCIAYPRMIKHRPQFFAAVGLAVLIILVDCLGHLIGSSKFFRFTYFLNALFQIGGILLLVMSTGGQSLSELAGEMQQTIKVIRRGGEEEEIIVPLKGEQPRAK